MITITNGMLGLATLVGRYIGDAGEYLVAPLRINVGFEGRVVSQTSGERLFFSYDQIGERTQVLVCQPADRSWRYEVRDGGDAGRLGLRALIIRPIA